MFAIFAFQPILKVHKGTAPSQTHFNGHYLFMQQITTQLHFKTAFIGNHLLNNRSNMNVIFELENELGL